MKQRLRFLADFRSKSFAGQLPDEIAFLPMEAIGERGEYDHDCVRSRDEIGQGYGYFDRGDIVRAKVTPCFENGKGAILEDLPTVCGVGSTELIAIAPRSGTDPRFLYYVMMSAEFLQGGEASLFGAHGVKRVPDDYFRNFRSWAPELGRQQAIADYLDRETTRLDILIATKKEMMRLARERFSAEVDGRTGQAGGPLVPIRRLVSAVTTGSRDWSDLVLDGDGYFIRATNLSRHSTEPDLAYAKLARLQSPRTAEARRAMLQSGDVLVCVTGYPGSVAYWAGQVAPAFVSQHVAALRPAAGIVGQWMAFALLAPSVQAQVTARQYGGTKQGLGLDDIKELRVALISPTQQATVAAKLADAQANMHSLVVGCDHQLDLLREKRQALITAAVTGQIDMPGAA